MNVITPRRHRDHRIPFATALKIERLYARAQRLIDKALADYAKRRVDPADGLPRTVTGRPDMRTRQWKARQDARRAGLDETPQRDSEALKALRRERVIAKAYVSHYASRLPDTEGEWRRYKAEVARLTAAIDERLALIAEG